MRSGLSFATQGLLHAASDPPSPPPSSPANGRPEHANNAAASRNGRLGASIEDPSTVKLGTGPDSTPTGAWPTPARIKAMGVALLRGIRPLSTDVVRFLRQPQEV